MSDINFKAALLQNRRLSASSVGMVDQIADESSMWTGLMNGVAPGVPRGENHTLSCKCSNCKCKHRRYANNIYAATPATHDKNTA